MRRPRLIPILCAAFGVVVGALVILHTPLLNGPPFFPWQWRVVPALHIYPLLALAAAPFFLGQWTWARYRRAAPALAIVMIACMALKLAAVIPLTDPWSLQVIRVIVEDRDTTSYYTDAAALNSREPVREWLPQYPGYMPHLSLHSQTKAPGPILYYTLFIQWLGVSGTTALVAGIVLGALATLSIPATYLLLRTLTGDRKAAFHAASFLALCPGFVLFFPMFDPTYILLSCGMIGLWAAALHRRSWPLAASLGAVLTAMSWISFNVLVLGFFMAVYPAVILSGSLKERALAALRIGAVAIGVWIGLLVITFLITGYDPLATFVSAWRNQQALLAEHGHTRPWPLTVPFDLTDFALGSGWLSVAVAVAFFTSTAKRIDSRLRRLAWLCVAQLAVVALSGLLQTETARVWNFMLPLWMVPVALAMREWTHTERAMVYASLWFVLATVAQNMKLLY